MKNNLTKEYLLPTRIVAKSSNVINAEALLVNKNRQIFFNEPNILECNGKGYIILDYGKEIAGGVRILSSYLEGQKKDIKIRIRFGESVNETCAEVGEKNATQHHSVRDLTVVMPDLSDQEWGQTGFRFVRIDFLDDYVYRMVNAYAVSTYRGDLVCNGDFKCNDNLLNDIFDTAKYTVFVTMQNCLIEGIKRDRLIWVGDMQPQVRAILDLFGEDDSIEYAVDESVARNQLPKWMGNIATYSCWLIQIIHDYYFATGKEKYARKHLDYINGILEQMDACVDEQGVIDFDRCEADSRNGFFVDWPTRFTPDAEAGNAYIFIYALNSLKRLYSALGVDNSAMCDKIIAKLRNRKYQDVKAKQIVALGFLAGEIDKEEAKEKLTCGGAKGLSTFMSYFILKALVECAGAKKTLEILKEYYGGMLSRGATTFWEDFDVEWLEGSGRIDEITPAHLLDLHGDFGKFCYKGFRHSLCHGWSCGPVQFLIEDIMGVKILDEACKSISVKPNLGDLTECSGSFPTPFGKITIEHKVVDGVIQTKIDAPSEIQIIR